MTTNRLTDSISKVWLLLIFFFVLFFDTPWVSAGEYLSNEIVINEVMASNTSTIQDRDGEYPDWIELYNTGDMAVDLSGFGLSDDPSDLFKWVFPAVTIEPGEYKLIFASDKNVSTEEPYLHTNFKIKAEGEALLLTDPSGFIVDQISPVEMASDLSFGRKPDGGSDWVFFTEATPGEGNTTNGFAAYSSPVNFSHKAGFYEGSISVRLTTSLPNAQIRYTLDGSDPDESSILYESSIPLDETTVLRARSFEAETLPGKIGTNTYLFNEQTTLPVISLTTDPKNMFDRFTGIYQNYKQDWERPVHIEFFETDKQQKFSEDAGIKIGGNNTRGRAQKAFHINFKGRYGPDKIEYQVFPDVPVFEFTNLYLRAAGNDWDQAHFRDGMLQRLVQDLELETQAYRPATIFLNGEYWGILNIRQRYNSQYFLSEYGIDSENLDLIEHAHPNDFMTVKEGDLDAFTALFGFIENNDISDNDNYEYIQTKMEINSFLDWLISEIYFNNTDWPTNNVMMWRPKTDEGKFRWVLFDLDWSYGYQRTRKGDADENTYKGNTLTWALGEDKMFTGTMFRKFLENEEFKTEFINRFADYLNTVFEPEHVKQLISETQAHLEPEMPRHYERFKTDPISKWYEYVTIVENFAVNRPQYIRQHIEDYFGLTKTVQLETQIENLSGGHITLNHISISDSVWQGDYFAGVPVKLTAVPNRGYTFLGWSGDVLSDSATISRVLSDDVSFTAHFERDSSALEYAIINEINYHSSDTFNPEDWIELHNPSNQALNISGWALKDTKEEEGFIIPENTVIDSMGYWVFTEQIQPFRDLFRGVENVSGNLGFSLNNGGETIWLYNKEGLLIDSVSYDHSSPWPVQADGNGPTLSLKHSQLDNSLGSSWQASNRYGTPGIANNLTYVSVEEPLETPANYVLTQNYPNPFNPSTNIQFGLPEPSQVRLVIYNSLGQEIMELVNEQKLAGYYTVSFEASGLSSGVYLYRLTTPSFSQTKKMLLIK